MNLWVDDLRDPKRFANGEWHWAKTNTEAIRVLATQEIDIVSLDHDICHTLPAGVTPPADVETKTSMLFQPITCPEDFTAVARYIVAMPEDRRPVKVVIHTGNPAGAQAISDILGDKIDIISIRMAQELHDLPDIQ